MKIKNVTIIGLDILGGSFGLAIKRFNPDIIVTGVDKGSIIVRAKNLAAIDNGCLYSELGECVKNADLIFLSTSIRGIKDIIPKIVPFVKDGAIITDTGMTKRSICNGAEEILRKDVIFIGGHPIVGFKRGGIELSDPYMFSNSPYVLTPLHESQLGLNILKKLIEGIGSNVFIMDPITHDKLMGEINSVLQIMAITHVNCIFSDLDGSFIDVAAVLGGERFKNFTQPLLIEPYYWVEIFKSNLDIIKNYASKFIKNLKTTIESLESDDLADFYKTYEKSKEYISKVSMYTKGFQSKLYYLYVTIEDKPDSIAKLTSFIAEEGFDIRDIELVKIKENEAVLIKVAFESQSIASKVGKLLMGKGYRYKMYIGYDMNGKY